MHVLGRMPRHRDLPRMAREFRTLIKLLEQDGLRPSDDGAANTRGSARYVPLVIADLHFVHTEV